MGIWDLESRILIVFFPETHPSQSPPFHWCSGGVPFWFALGLAEVLMSAPGAWRTPVTREPEMKKSYTAPVFSWTRWMSEIDKWRQIYACWGRFITLCFMPTRNLFGILSRRIRYKARSYLQEVFVGFFLMFFSFNNIFGFPVSEKE